MSIAHFIDTAFREYADYDNQRNIPNLMDGLKISQRKILWTFYKVLGKSEVVVDRAAMRAAEFTFYRHGGQNLYDVITGMAQNFPGSNNVNLLEPLGQFGTRMIKDASSPRYISTKLNDNFNKLFSDIDFDILDPLYDEGQEVEPLNLLPKLPLQLLNGSIGTGNGFASTIYSYNPKDVAKAVQEVLKHGVVKTPLIPWMRGYKGIVKKDPLTKQITITGLLDKTNSTTITITEIPPEWNLEKYKAHLNKLIDQKLIKDYDNESTEDEWRFVIDCPRTTVQMELYTLMEKFRLIQRDTETLAVWLPNRKIKIYKSVEDMVVDWVNYRLEFYEKRRIYQIEKFELKLEWLETKKNFIVWWNENSAELVKLKKSELTELIRKEVTSDDDYIDRLLNVRVSNLSIEEVDELDKDIAKNNQQKEELENTSDFDMMQTEVKALRL